MKPPAEDPSALSPYRAFVVQFRAEADIAHDRCTGRVEHVVSGQAPHFASLEELLAFIARVLTTVRAPPPRRLRRGPRDSVVRKEVRPVSVKAFLQNKR
jgi:hypothetical protein